MNEKINRIIHFIFIGLFLASIAGNIILLGPKRIPVSITDRMERLQTELQAAYEGQSAIGIQLASTRRTLHESKKFIGESITGLEESQQLTDAIIGSIEDSRDAERIIKEATAGIGEFLEGVEQNNKK